MICLYFPFPVGFLEDWEWYKEMKIGGVINICMFYFSSLAAFLFQSEYMIKIYS